MDNKYDPIGGQVMPVFFRYALPSVAGLLAVSSASVIDAMFLGNVVGPVALAAVNLTMPATSLLFALTFMLSVGGSVIAGKYLGQGNEQAASEVFSKVLFTALIAVFVLLIPSLMFLPQLTALLGTNAAVYESVMTYLTIILLFSPALAIGIGLYYFVMVDNRPLLASGSLISSAAVNILLDWLFIVKLDMGVAGAAYATGLAQVVVLLVLLPYLFDRSAKLKLVKLQGEWRSIGRAAVNGISEFTNEMSVGIVVLIINGIMITQLGTNGVAAFTIVEYLLFIGVMIFYGFAEALQPIISKNMGAGQTDRISRFLLTALLSNLAVGVAIAALLVAIPDALIAIFLREGEESTIAIAKHFMSLFWPAFLFNGMNIALTSYFTALHKPLSSGIISLSRSLVLPALLLFILPIWWGMDGVYIAVPIAEFITFLLALGLLARHKHKP